MPLTDPAKDPAKDKPVIISIDLRLYGHPVPPADGSRYIEAVASDFYGRILEIAEAGEVPEESWKPGNAGHPVMTDFEFTGPGAEERAKRFKDTIDHCFLLKRPDADIPA